MKQPGSDCLRESGGLLRVSTCTGWKKGDVREGKSFRDSQGCLPIVIIDRIYLSTIVISIIIDELGHGKVLIPVIFLALKLALRYFSSACLNHLACLSFFGYKRQCIC